MDVIVKATCEVSARLKEEAKDRLGHAARFFDRLDTVDMIFSAEHNPRIADKAQVEVTAYTKGHQIRAEGRGPDHRAALDIALNRFERQLSRYKARMVDRQRGKGRVPIPSPRPFPVGPAEHDGHREEGPRIVRVKRFDLAPMLPDEAAMQLELLDHQFFVFTNATSGACNVVYRRADGDLGLIETGAAGDDV